MINTFDLVMIPRITKMSTHPSHSLTKTLADNMNIQLMLTIPMVFGLIAIMPSFYLWFWRRFRINCAINDHFGDTRINHSIKYADK